MGDGRPKEDGRRRKSVQFFGWEKASGELPQAGWLQGSGRRRSDGWGHGRMRRQNNVTRVPGSN